MYHGEVSIEEEELQGGRIFTKPFINNKVICFGFELIIFITCLLSPDEDIFIFRMPFYPIRFNDYKKKCQNFIFQFQFAICLEIETSKWFKIKI